MSGIPASSRPSPSFDIWAEGYRIVCERTLETMMKKIEPKEIQDNAVQLIGDDWMLVTAGSPEHFNMMTASWGGLGFMWKKPVAFVVIRPQRHTFRFIEAGDELTLSFFSHEYHKALTVCGTTSGRDTDKVAASGLTPYVTENGNVSFTEARLVLECRKLYAEPLNPEAFLDKTIVPEWYAAGDFHKMYIVEILNVWVKE